LPVILGVAMFRAAMPAQYISKAFRLDSFYLLGRY